MANRTPIDMAVFHKYAGISLPRHVAYPMPSWWDNISGDEARSMLAQSSAQMPARALSLYLHIPYCEALCKFCACNKVILRKNHPSASETVTGYLGALEREIRSVSALKGCQRPVRQIHWGGGSPTYLECETIARFMRLIRDNFSVADDAEIAMEIDPRHSPDAFLAALRQLGFNRVSMGVQDFDARVQEHVHRIQPLAMVRDVVANARELGFLSVNFDLIYGLPYQTLDTVRRTLEAVIKLSPDRVAYYHYAQIPEKIATQRGIHHFAMPESDVKLDMFLTAIELFEEAGYEFVGLDHFAKSDEALATAARNGQLQRNFQGMTTGGGLDLVGVGVSAISHLTQLGFYQNAREPDEYVLRVGQNHSPVSIGKWLSFDDCVRQAVINQIYCAAAIRPKEIEATYAIRFDEYFARELRALDTLLDDGLVTIDGTAIRLTFPLGRVLMRNVAAVFDAYLDPEAYRRGTERMFSVNA